MKNLRITNKYRFLTFLLFLLIVVNLLFTNLIKNNYVYSSKEIKYQLVEVYTGDTLWNIAKEYIPEDYDIRQLIFEIEIINSIDNAYIYPGQILKIPTY